MATGNAGTGEETGPGAESNEHDYAHTENGAVTPHAASVGPQAASVTPQAASVTPQAASIGPQTASVGPQVASVTPQAASVGPQVAFSSPHAASSSPHAASVGPQTASVGPQGASSSPHAASVGPQTASVGPQVGPQAASVGPQTASVGPQTASVGPQTASVGPLAASVGPEAASIGSQAASSSGAPVMAAPGPGPGPAVGLEVAGPGPAVGLEVAGPGPRRPRRPEDAHCSCCRLLFQRHGRSFNRRAVHTFTSPDTVRWVFPGCAVTDRSFLCETCAQVVRTRGKRKQSGKRCLWLKPPAPKKVKERPASGRRMGKKSKAALLVSKSSYKAAFQMLWSAKGARKPMMEFFSKQLKMEMKALSRRPDSPFQLKVSGRRPLASFPWRRCLSWAQDHAPLTTSCLRAMFPELKSSRQLTEEQAVMLLERRTVVALAVPLFTRNIWRNNFLQAALGAELRLQGCSGAALDALNAMGLCQNKDTVRLLLQRLRNGAAANRDSGMMHKLLDEEMGEEMSDEEEEEEEDDEEDEEEDEDEDEEEDEEDEEEVAEEEVVLEDEEHGEEEMMMAIEEEVEEEEIQEQVQEEEEPPANEKEVKKRRSKKARRLGKRKERGGGGGEEEEEEEGQRKRKVVVVRLGLLKGHSEVGRSDLSAP